MKKFISTERKGFKMTFENGYTVSVQWGHCNYCHNMKYMSEITNNDDMDGHYDAESDTAEVVIMKDGIFVSPYEILRYKNPSDDKYTASNVLGYVTPEMVAYILSTVGGYREGSIDYDKLISFDD